MLVNGKEYNHNYITHETLLRGADIMVRMSTQPNRSRGTADEDAPYSFSKETR